MRFRINATDLFLVCLTPVLVLLAMPQSDLEILCWVSFVPWLVALEGKGPKETFVLSYITGLVFFGGVSYWVWSVQAFRLLDFILLAFFFPHYASLWALALNWVRKNTGLSVALIGPPLWVTLEYIRSHFGFLAVPWMLLGHSQYLNTPLMQIASITGAYGLSFLIVLVNAAIAEVVCYFRNKHAGLIVPKSPVRAVIAASGLLMASLLYGVLVLSQGSGGERLSIGLVQGNIPQKLKWQRGYQTISMEKYTRLTRDVAEHEPALIVWPETAVPGDVKHRRDLKDMLGQLAEESNAYLLVGSAEHAKFDRKIPKTKSHSKFYNSMFLFSPEGTLIGEYRKIRLLPFGEYPPLKDWIRWPKTIVSSMGNFLPGTEFTVFNIGDTKISTVICWEAIFADQFRQFVKRGAQVMVATSNEAWFGDTALPYQILAMTAFRAAENRVAVVRSANTGLSAFIDPFGRIVERVRGENGKELFVDGILFGTVPLSNGMTFYTRYGDVFAITQVGICVLVFICLLLKAWVPVRLSQGERAERA